MNGEPQDYRMARSWIILCWIFCNVKTVICLELNDTEKGLFPIIFNLATNAIIVSNATCGEKEPEVFCKLVEHVLMRRNFSTNLDSYHTGKPQCDTCNANSAKPEERHPIENAIDGTNRWWQSPSLANGDRFRYVTITLDLKQVYQVAYIIIKSANSPRPGSWILERSLDGINFKPWQFYAISDGECYERYHIQPTVGNPRYRSDDEVICTSYFSKLNPLENGEIHTSLVNGRPGVKGPSNTLREFTTTRFVRLRLQNIRTLHADLMGSEVNSADLSRIDKSVSRRFFYSIKDISIGGQCICYGHAKDCTPDKTNENLRCKCQHNTCGESCEKCCPLFNQKPWRPGTSEDAAPCEPCQCFNHADECVYDEEVAASKTSLIPLGIYDGGGRCLNCKHNTIGINCEKCIDGFFRPQNIDHTDRNACQPCKCKGPGTAGGCMKDDSQISNKLFPGDCICKDGFAGTYCDRCAPGFRNFPICDPCPCFVAGTRNIDNCDGDCICKTNVEGSRCERCKAGFFHLDAKNPLGCTQCFCFGITRKCTGVNWFVETISEMRGWKITNFQNSQSLFPMIDHGSVIIADSDVASYNEYFWSAPKTFLGNKLTAYGGKFQYTASFRHPKRDAGNFLSNPDVILEGSGIRLGRNEPFPLDRRNRTVILTMTEEGWLRVNDEGHFSGGIEKKDFMEVLANLKRLLIKAKYHTRQKEASLSAVSLEVASKSAFGPGNQLPLVEQCQCPRGFHGLSCESCQNGYRRKDEILYEGQCLQCECNGYSETCNSFTGDCLNCKHNTAGPFCDQCDRGYYGNPYLGFPDVCKHCSCPLNIHSNNFSPTCSLTPFGQDFICTACPPGYMGTKCELCSDGYFGQPHVPGNYCQPCICSGNIDIVATGNCDKQSGQCLKCIVNTGGWNCERCKSGFWGNALRQDCRECECNLFGSDNLQCDQKNGQCPCKPNYVGQKCDVCAVGFGNIAAGCLACNCNKIGSITSYCDSVSGMCNCKPGVFGSRCDSCAEFYYGFSSNGCKKCDCDSIGSVNGSCDQRTGQCVCKPNVTGQTCDRCQEGYYNFATGHGCKACNCHPIGSESQICDSSGICFCKSGVGEEKCNKCLPGFYGLSRRGCRECPKCQAPGQVCDAETGDCVCPPLTSGQRCERCVVNAWSYDSLYGCKACDCNLDGSLAASCNPDTGQCQCKDGFHGVKCNECRYGFFNFPRCRSCHCVNAGTQPSQCNLVDACQCNNDGQCPCKENVDGRRCHNCKQGTFSLSAANPLGCTQCYCFGRSNKCTQAPYVWNSIIHPDKNVAFSPGVMYFETIHNLSLIPDKETINLPDKVNQPMYWRLPKQFLGDKVASYNGTLSFNIWNNYFRSSFEDEGLGKFPVVLIQGNFRIVLEYYADIWPTDGIFQVPFHENFWKIKMNDHMPVTRQRLMVALQNLQHIFIRATVGPGVRKARLQDISMTVGRPDNFTSDFVAWGVELCECPKNYEGSSCQDPSDGYWRKKKPNYLDSVELMDLVGEAVICSCHVHSNNCDKETGVCMDCKHNTIGEHCELCAPGFYGDSTRGRFDDCKPCECPSPRNSFSPTCIADATDYYCDNCERGYRGRHCDECDDGFFGNPNVPKGKCSPCSCNLQGSLYSTCDRKTGQCTCKKGLSGRDCSQCQPGYVITQTGFCMSCVDDECTGLLLKDIAELVDVAKHLNTTGLRPAPWGKLWAIEQQHDRYRPQINFYLNSVGLGEDLLINLQAALSLEKRADSLFIKAMNSSIQSTEVIHRAMVVKANATMALNDLQYLFENIQDVVNNLHKFMEAGEPRVNLRSALREAERILRDVRKKDFDPAEGKTEEELAQAKDLLVRVLELTMDQEKLKKIQDNLSNLTARLDDLVILASKRAEQPAEETDFLNELNRARLEKLQITKEKIMGLGETIDQQFLNSMKLLDLAKEYLEEPRLVRSKWQKFQRDLNNASDILITHEGILSQLIPQYEIVWVSPAKDHADALAEQAAALVALYNSTKNATAEPLKAAQVYDRIVYAINEAEAAAYEANEAAENASLQASLGRPDSLLEKSKISKHLSGILAIEARDLLARVPTLRRELDITIASANIVEDDIQEGFDELSKLHYEPIDIQHPLKPTLQIIQNAEEQASDIAAVAADFKNRISTELKPKFDALAGFAFEGLDNVSKIVRQARDDIRACQRVADGHDLKVKNIKNISMRLNDSLQTLRNKILTARQRASTIRISVSADRRGRCERSFKPIIEPSPSNVINLVYATETPNKESLLLFIGHPSLVDFMAIEVINHKVRFIWNAGGGTTVLEHPLQLKRFDHRDPKKDFWYMIEILRIGELTTLSVKDKRNGFFDDPQKVSKAGPPGFARMDLDTNSFLNIGRIPDSLQVDKEILSNSFSGCLSDVVIDNKRIGLWNFLLNNGCQGCTEGPLEQDGYEEFQFNGDGYAIQPQIIRYSNRQYSITMQFRTFDEDALLIFIPNEIQGDFVSLHLKGGHIYYQFYLGTLSSLKLMSKNKYNTGQWITVVGERTHMKGQLIVTPDSGERELLTGLAPTSALSLELRQAFLYIGGIPPGFKMNAWEKFNVTTKSFLGCMKSPVIGTLTLDLLQNTNYGIERGCKLQLVRDIGFEGNGYLELGSHSLNQQSSLAFSFSTNQKNALLLLSTFAGQTDGTTKNDHFYSIALVDGKLVAKFNNGGTTETITSSKVFNDGFLHSISVVRQQRRVELKVDDDLVGSIRLSKGMIIQIPEKGGLFLGGIKSGLRVQDQVATLQGLKGCMRDVVINQQLLNLGAPTAFNRVSIGRCASSLTSLPPTISTITSVSQVTEFFDLRPSSVSLPLLSSQNQRKSNGQRCGDEGSHPFEQQATSFGNVKNSYAKFEIKKARAIFNKNFQISFDFRTFYGNGLIAFAANNDLSNSLRISLKSGRINVNIEGKIKQEIFSHGGLNDGSWRNVTIAKNNQKLILTVNGQPENSGKIAQKLNINGPLYIGGLPNKPKLRDTVWSNYIGCIRKFIFIKNEIDLSTVPSENVGHCFSKIEAGIYFPGNAYAVLDDNFMVGSKMFINVEFRTTRSDGIIVTLGGLRKPSLGLELKNGKLIFSVDDLNIRGFNATTAYKDEPFRLCDGRWHTITASFIKNVMTLKVDQEEMIFGYTEDALQEIKTNAPLYIGGFPEEAKPQSSISGTENFNGCLRSLFINDERVTFSTEMKLHNVVLNSCPSD